MTEQASAVPNPRDVARIVKGHIKRGYSDAHKVRPLLEPGDWINTDPFLVLMEDWFPAGVFDKHPHRGLETVTYVVEGKLDHFDNHGNAGIIGEGDVQWLTAGRGLIHDERPVADLTVHSLQLWVVLPKADKLVPTHYQTIAGSDAPVRHEPGASLKVFSGTSGSVTSPTTNHVPVTMVELLLEPNVEITQGLPADYNGFVVLLEGDLIVGTSKTAVTIGDAAWFTRSADASSISIQAGATGARALLYAGKPLNEPLETRDPFVMNTVAELDEAYRAFREMGDSFGL
jgi:redox-sensitive bicupin YhaK (pirin superfamily)